MFLMNGVGNWVEINGADIGNTRTLTFSNFVRQRSLATFFGNDYTKICFLNRGELVESLNFLIARLFPGQSSCFHNFLEPTYS
jgi:hypothetical protein